MPATPPYPPASSRTEYSKPIRAGALALALVMPLAHAARAAEPQAPQHASDARPYDDKLMRLSEVIGAVHYLRELCGANDGQTWRDRMRDLIESEKGSALRKVRLTKSFNHGYRSYRRTYQSCSQAAQTALGRFLVEGAELSEAIVRETQ